MKNEITVQEKAILESKVNEIENRYIVFYSDNDDVWITKKQYDAIKLMLNDVKFIEIKDEIYNVSNIKSINKVKEINLYLGDKTVGEYDFSVEKTNDMIKLSKEMRKYDNCF